MLGRKQRGDMESVKEILLHSKTSLRIFQMHTEKETWKQKENFKEFMVVGREIPISSNCPIGIKN